LGFFSQKIAFGYKKWEVQPFQSLGEDTNAYQPLIYQSDLRIVYKIIRFQLSVFVKSPKKIVGLK